MSGIGPGTGVGDAGTISSCAVPPTIPLAARMAPTHTLRMRTLVLVMVFSSLLSPEAEPHWVSPDLLNGSPPPPSTLRLLRAAISSRNDAHAAGERLGDDELAVNELERQRRQGTRRRTVDDSRG